MIIEIFVTQREAEQPLGDQPLHRMLDALLAPVVIRPPDAASARSASRNSATPPSERLPSPTTLRLA